MSLQVLALGLLLGAAPPSPDAGTAGAPPLAPDAVALSVLPERPYVEQGPHGAQHLNFDLALNSRAAVPLQVVKVELDVHAADGQRVWSRRLERNGFSPGLAVAAAKQLPAGGQVFLFNPFHSLPRGLELSALHYRITLEELEGSQQTLARLTVRPRAFAQGAQLHLPLRGRMFVHSGHDYLAHHRRLDLGHPVLGVLGVTRNAGRYALDLCASDAQGRLFRGEGKANEEWVGWGAPLYAPGAGTVVVALDGAKDNRVGGPPYRPDLEELKANPMENAGNVVVIDHGRGEYSLLAHLQRGSVSVKVGQRVKAGQQVGRVGMSGDAYIPHVHYELRDGKGASFGSEGVEGLPARFTGFRRVLGQRSEPVALGAVDSGDYLEH